MKPLARAALVPLLCAVLATGGSAFAASLGDKIHDQQGKVQATQSELAHKRGQLEIARVRTQDISHQLDETTHGIALVNANLDELNGEVQQSQKRLSWNKVQLDAAEATLARHNDALRGRLVDAYERGDIGYLNVLLSATSWNEFVERWDDIRYLIAESQKTVRERRVAERAVSAVRARLQGEQIRLDGQLAAQQRVQGQLAALAEQRRGLLAAADLQRRTVAGQVAELEELSANQEGELEAMIRERQREEEERRAREAEARRRAALLSGQAPPPPNAGAPGAFSWPVSGPITSPFGLRPNPMGAGFETHPGIDIGAPQGATISAAAGGRVIFAGWYGGYGNAIIIDHGGSTSSLYGHCSQIFVAVGQDVQRGQAIGAVGMTGRATGPHLHFEVRINGVPVDPVPRLR